MEKPSGFYLGEKPCGCVVASAAYSYDDRRDTAELVADMIRKGLHVKWVSFGTQFTVTSCPHGEIAGDGQIQRSLCFDDKFDEEFSSLGSGNPEK